jgi:elongator complex protein 3
MWKKGKYKNYAPDLLVEVIAKALAFVPPWVRVY